MMVTALRYSRPTGIAQTLVVTGVMVAGLVVGCPSVGASPPVAPIYGVTIDHISHIAATVAAEQSLPERPNTRVYFEVSEPAAYYQYAVARLHSVSSVMGELLDSSDATSITPAAYEARVQSYLATLGTSVDIWEIGNEVNGNWTGPYTNGATDIEEAYEAVSAAGSVSALTLYANEYGPDNCGDGTAELTPVQYSEQYVPPSVRDGISYVFESYYPTECGNTYPTSAEVATEMTQLHALYPKARLGFGEVGLPRPATKRTLATAERVMSWAYSLQPHLPYYVGGYFWWYSYQDVFWGKRLLADSLSDAFRTEAAALG
ncbi:MAG: hypothetical protein ACLQPH_11080 [Acidimicrobiales bacterium]